MLRSPLSVRSRFAAVAGSVAFLITLVGPALAPGDLAPRAAHAGQYSVYACDFAGGANNSWGWHADATMLVQSVCPSRGDADKGFGMLDDFAHPASRAANGARAQWTFLAPENSGIDAIRFAAHGFKQQWSGHSSGSSVWSVGLYGGWSRDPNQANEAMSACAGLTICSLGGVGIATDTSKPAADRWVELAGRPSARFMVRCDHSTDCFIDGSGVGAWLAVHGVQVLVGNWTPPWQGMYRDGAFDGGWKRGEVRATWDAYDDVSVKHQHLDIAGRRFLGRDYDCDYTHPRPCAGDTVTASDVIDTRSLPDGVHGGNVGVTDAADNTSNHGFTLRVDNNAPAKVSDLQVEGGEAWRSTNGFDIAWTNGDQGAGSPISTGRYRLCNTATGACSEGSTSGLDRITGFDVPGSGEYTLRVAAVDAAGQGPWSDPVTLRYDSGAPGVAAPSHNNGWVNAQQAKAYDQEIRLAQSAARPASGIAGYSVAMDAADPDETVDALGDPATYRIPEDQLTEGEHTFKARAVSGSGVGSSDIGTTAIRVDRTAPSIAMHDVPQSEWSAGAVTVTVKGTDQNHLSGMAGSDPEQPVERGAYVTYKIDDQPSQKVRGAEANVRVEGDGVHTITYQAFDLAGNPSIERQATIKIDSSAPGRAKLDEPDGWLSKSEAATFDGRFTLADEAARPASGIRGYSITTDGSQPDESIDVAGDPGIAPLRDLSEGVNTIRARAISGAGVGSGDVGTGQVKVDLSNPIADASGQPEAEWARAPVTLTLTGSDQPGLSGMVAGPQDQPIENGAFMGYRVDGGALERRRGGQTELSVFGDGSHAVTYFATDAAGNAGAERSVQFKIDATAPETVAFEAHDSADPRRLSVVASDRTSGIASGVIELRRVGAGEWQALATRKEGNRFIAPLDDEQLDPSATYELRARVKDVAGNEAVGDRRTDGQPAVISGSLRRGTRMSSGGYTPGNPVKTCRKKKRRKAGRSRRKRVCRTTPGAPFFSQSIVVPYGQATTVEGQLSSEDGQPIAGAVIDVEARLRAVGAEFRPEGAARTDGTGRFTYTAPAGASRTLRFRYQGSNTDRPTFSDMDVSVPAALTLKANKKRVANKKSVRFSGALLGAPLPPGGVKVDLQVYYRKKWRTFATPRTDAAGAFSYRYRFQTVKGVAVFAFRARLKPEAAYPYDLGDSRKVKVRVRGR